MEDLVVLNDEVNVAVGADVCAVLIGALEIYLEVGSAKAGIVRFKGIADGCVCSD